MKYETYEWEDVRKRLPTRTEDSHKGTYGKLLLIAGSENMAGAAALAAKAAYRGGAGLVYLYTPQCNRIILQILIPEAVLCTYPDGEPDITLLMSLLEKTDAVAIGPGIGTKEEMNEVVRVVLSSERRKVLDADALNLYGREPGFWGQKKGDVIVTPHLLEMSRMNGKSVKEIQEDKVRTAVEFSQRHQVITVLKDHHTIVTDGKSVYRNQTGNHGMATGGSGDVLTGLIGSLLVQGSETLEAAKLGVYLHGKAGDDAASAFGKRSLMAGDIADYVCRGL